MVEDDDLEDEEPEEFAVQHDTSIKKFVITPIERELQRQGVSVDLKE